jgi:glycosyltransferase involved in cell wall biosynthesis
MPPAKKGLALSLVQRGIDRVVVWGGLQKDLLGELFGVAESRLVETCYFVDQQFFHPMDIPTDSICAVGNSKRDYATLIQAMRGLPITCNIMTTARPIRDVTSDYGVTGQALSREAAVPDNVVVRSASPLELRACYARAKFAVAPLFPNLRDHGITTIAEAMAMGKAVIASNIRGLPDFFEDGVTGLLVPPGDPAALRAAIEYLWAHPEVAALMGAEGRRRAETLFALDRFVASVRQVVDEAVGANAPLIPIDHSWQGMAGQAEREAAYVSR